MGPEPIIAGSTPTLAQDAIRASGVSPRFCASAAVIKITTAAPSLMPDALAAVTVPSFIKAERSLVTLSKVTPFLIYSSSLTITSPLRPAIVTAQISSLNLPAICAASALFCEATAKASCSARVICHLVATFSAVFPM